MNTDTQLFKMTARGNMLANGDGFWISYRADTGFMGRVFSGDDGSETALCHNGKYYILNGDWRDQYAEVINQGFDACLAVFLKNAEHKSSWSNTP